MPRSGLVTVVVLGAAALVLCIVDRIPGFVAGVPAGVRLCTTLEQAEARTGLRLPLVHDLLVDYEPVANGIRVTSKPEPAIAVAMQRRQNTPTRLTLFRSSGKEIPTSLRPPLPSYHEITIPLSQGDSQGPMASLKAESLPDGSVWQDMEWSSGPGRIALRFNGRTVELLRLSKRLAKGAP